MTKKLLFSFLISLLSLFIFSQEQKYQLSTHILDINTGAPASGVSVQLEKETEKGIWKKINDLKTDENGRINSFLPTSDNSDNKGIYKLTFFTQPYFTLKKVETFYPYIQILFEIKDNKHYHVPITLSPFGYSTYRGS